MSEKVTIPKEIAVEIEAIRSKGKYKYTDRYLLSLAFSFTFGTEGRTLHDYASENYDTYVNAIVNGYTVEQTPEENVREYYDNTVEIEKAAGSDGDYYSGQIYAIEYVLTLLGIRIKGINA